ncbi:tRNA modification GTPase [Parelusimicrobium proximum]|uniref:tRNA uridine-5-carboxymethylaminomethyl(34) synthesis GTPase MnmE n=1 Tax=Parelusimicrobium proximum TaxID=3228953 RepID=UPI003D17F582
METICAISTAPGKGAVSVIRISGEKAWESINSLLLSPFTPEPRKAYLKKISDGPAVLDSAVITFFSSPASFTGEDTVEVSVHGSPYITGRLMELLSLKGVRPARAGEFSMRAFLNGKMDLLESQALCDLISADAKAAHDVAIANLEGQLSKRFADIKDSLSSLLAQIEVRLDDSDEEMAPLDKEFVFGEIDKALENVKALAASYSTGRLIKDGIKVCIAGLPNAGKSSLLNSLLGYDRAIVSEEKGTTRDTIEDSLEKDGYKIVLTDTAGIHQEAKGYAETAGVERSLRAAKTADIVVFVSDSSDEESIEEDRLYAELREINKNIILAANKTDKPYKKAYPYAHGDAVKISCKTGAGIEELKEKIISIIKDSDIQINGALITSAIQYNALLNMMSELDMAKGAYGRGGEFCAEHIRAAINAVRETVGEVTADDILGIIFEKFCVGK